MYSSEWVRDNLSRAYYDNYECQEIAYKLNHDNYYRQDVERYLRQGYRFETAIDRLGF